MTNIVPTLNTSIRGVPRVIWSNVTSADTIEPFILTDQHGLAGGVQAVGTLGGATVSVEVSNTGATGEWAAAPDVLGVAVSLVAATNYAELSLSPAYIRPTITGGSGYSITVVMTLRG